MGQPGGSCLQRSDGHVDLGFELGLGWSQRELKRCMARAHARVRVEGPAVRSGLATQLGSVGIGSGDRIVEVDGVAVDDQTSLVEAVQRGEARKIITVERGGESRTEPARIELTLDWTGYPDEVDRQQRRADRRERFGPELRPWDPETGVNPK